MTLPEFRTMLAFMDEMREHQHWDVVYAWAKLVKDHAFYYAASSEYPRLRVKS